MLNYPLTLSFKLIAFSPQVRVTDASGQLVLYVKQKALALREDVRIFADEAQSQQLYQLNANKIIDFSATYNISIPGGGQIGAVKRQGMRSIWKASYTILDAAGAELGVIHEENPWLKVAESFLADIPFIGMLINPGYLVDIRGQNVLYLKKQPAVFEGKFTIDKRGQFSEAEERVLLSSVIMTMMLERSRG